MDDLYDIEAVVTYLQRKKSGGTVPVSSGFQPAFCFDDERWIAELSYPEGNLVYPGDRVRVRLRFMDEYDAVNMLYIGMTFELKEGEIAVAEGTVREMVGE